MLVPGLIALSLSGCGSSTSEKTASTGNGGHEHAHPSEGPHGGSLIELGNEEYHAELVHDDAAGTVTIHILDSAAKASVPIDAGELTINVSHEGQAEQFKLSAASAEGEGKSSQFVSSSADLAQELDHEHAVAQLVVTINGKQYRGTIEHHHEHGDEHDHE
jgi:hypothetical protein